MAVRIPGVNKRQRKGDKKECCFPQSIAPIGFKQCHIEIQS
jgi:hypothetical protein